MTVNETSLLHKHGPFLTTVNHSNKMVRCQSLKRIFIFSPDSPLSRFNQPASHLDRRLPPNQPASHLERKLTAQPTQESAKGKSIECMEMYTTYK